MPRKTIAILALLLAILACNLPQETIPTPQILIITATSLPVTNTPLGVPLPIASATRFIPSTAQATITTVPCNRASFEKDVTYPDFTTVSVNQSFTKTWRLKNTGTCTWTSSYQLVFDNGDLMGGPASQPLTTGSVAPNQMVDISVNLIAPSTPGTYRGNWRIREPGGTLFGLSDGAFWVKILVTNESSNLPDWPVLTEGDSGPEVYALQYLLRFRGQSLTPDGIFGQQTRSTVINYQGSIGIPQDGTVGANTWSALIASQLPVQGSTGDAVRAVQQILHDKYSYPLILDGVFGTSTYEAVREFQLNYNLPADGTVTPDTWQALISY